MAVDDWDKVKKILLKEQITYEQFTKLYRNDWIKTLPMPTPVGEKLPGWLLQAFHPHQEEVRRAHRIEVSRDEASQTTVILARCDSGTLGVRLSDEFLLYHDADLAALIAPPPLPVVRSPYPILGWRQWRMGNTLSKKGMFGLFGQHWETPEMRAKCAKGHAAPAENCRCGIYFYKDQSYAHSEMGDNYVPGLVVATNVIEHQYGCRAGLVRCIGIGGVHPEAYGWDGIPILTDSELGKLMHSLREDPSLIPYPNDLPAP